jgi:hypothetical protein
MSTDVLSSKVQNVSHGFEKVTTTCVTMNYLPLVEQELLTLLEDLSSPLIFSGVRVTRFLVLVCLLYLFFWPLFCLFFFDIRILIIPLVSSNSSYHYGILEFNTGYVRVRADQSLALCVLLSRPFFVLAILLSVL